jgi:hypothetical protein
MLNPQFFGSQFNNLNYSVNLIHITKQMLTFAPSFRIEIKKFEKIHFISDYKPNFIFIPDNFDDDID